VIVTDVMAAPGPPELLGMHLDMPATVPPDVAEGVPSGAAPPPGLSADERRAHEQLVDVNAKGIGYAQEMGTQPQTLYGLADSPVGLASG
jgi:hypothetical protein